MSRSLSTAWSSTYTRQPHRSRSHPSGTVALVTRLRFLSLVSGPGLSSSPWIPPLLLPLTPPAPAAAAPSAACPQQQQPTRNSWLCWCSRCRRPCTACSSSCRRFSSRNRSMSPPPLPARRGCWRQHRRRDLPRHRYGAAARPPSLRRRRQHQRHRGARVAAPGGARVHRAPGRGRPERPLRRPLHRRRRRRAPRRGGGLVLRLPLPPTNWDAWKAALLARFQPANARPLSRASCRRWWRRLRNSASASTLTASTATPRSSSSWPARYPPR